MHFSYLTNLYAHHQCQKAMLQHTLQAPQMVHLDTVVSLFIAFAVACVSTSIQGLISHAFRQTIGDIIVTDNSLGDIDHIVPMLPAPNVSTKTETGKLSARRSWTSSVQNHVYTPVDNDHEETGHIQSKHSRFCEINLRNDDTSFGKRLDTRSFFPT